MTLVTECSPAVRVRMDSLAKARAVPEGVSPGFWSALLLQAAIGDRLSELLITKGGAWGSAHLDATSRGPARACFSNAAEQVLADPTLVYVEGYACTKTVPIPLAHAWVMRPDGRIQDPTWSDGLAYAGIPFSTSVVERVAKETGYWGLFGFHAPPWLVKQLQAWTPPEPVGLPTKGKRTNNELREQH